MDVHLVAAMPGAGRCKGESCGVDGTFDHEVALVGARLASAAYESFPELWQRVPAFSFQVADKAEAGSTSNSDGTVIIFRGTRCAGLDETALAFVIAREMGHVISRHHDERSATSILLSVLVQVLMPFTSLSGATATLTGSTASIAGTEVVNARNDAQQAREADAVAVELMKRQSWSSSRIIASLAKYERSLGHNAWSESLRQSLEALVQEQRYRPIPTKS